MARASILVVAALLAPAAAQAQWQRWSTGATSTYLQGVSSPNGQHVFAAGSDFTMSGMFPNYRPKVLASADAGRTFVDISGTLPGGLYPLGAVSFTTAYVGWVAVGEKVWATTTAGRTWTSSNAGAVGLALHFFDTERGVLVGEDGAIRRTTDAGRTWATITSPTSVALQSLFFLDEQRGWAAGWSQDDAGLVLQGVLLRTTDGGVTWTQVTTAGSVALGPAFFLCDGKTGWVAGYRTPDDDSYKAVLFKTTDGGATLQDAGLPTAVGKKSAMGFSGDLDASMVRAMYWEDEKRGHLAGMAYLLSMSESSSGGGGGSSTTTSYWDEVWYQTSDGGATWQKRDLGTVAFPMTSPPVHDNYIGGGLLRDLATGWMVGDGASVWGCERTCQFDEQCGEVYVCKEGRCARGVAPGCAGECATGQVKIDGRCQKPPDGSTEPGGGEGDGASDEREGLRFIGIDCGCSGATPAVPAALALVLVALRRRRAVPPSSRDA